MKQGELQHVRARLSGMTGACVRCIGYAADLLTLVIGGYHLHIQCSYRLASEEKIFFDRIDYFRPSEALRAKWRAAGIDEMDFPAEWEDDDCRLFEQVKRLNGDFSGMCVTEIGVNRLGDLTLRFTNGLTLLALPMRSDGDEAWRLFNDELWPDQHMVVCGDHVELSGPGEQFCPICE